MKSFVGVVLLAVVVAAVTPSKSSGLRGSCPSNQVTGICVFDPSKNCLSDSECKGGQLCCPDGCGKVCKDPSYNDSQQPQPPTPPPTTYRRCPRTPSTSGICRYDEDKNCLSDNECKNGQMCCADGCGKVCKDPVILKPLKPYMKSKM